MNLKIHVYYNYIIVNNIKENVILSRIIIFIIRNERKNTNK